MQQRIPGRSFSIAQVQAHGNPTEGREFRAVGSSGPRYGVVYPRKGERPPIASAQKIQLFIRDAAKTKVASAQPDPHRSRPHQGASAKAMAATDLFWL